MINIYLNYNATSSDRVRGVVESLSFKDQTNILAAPNINHTYEHALLRFTHIKQGDLYIACNPGGIIDRQCAHEIVYAMLTNKILAITDPPRYDKDVDLFFRQVISDRINKMVLCDITLFDHQDLSSFIDNVLRDSINYTFTKHMSILARSSP